MYQQDEFVKLTYPDGMNRGLQYKEGLNIDPHFLNRKEEYAAGGIFFCMSKNVGRWINEYGDALIWKVEIPEEEEVIDYGDKLKARRIILSQPKKAYEDDEICKKAVQRMGLALRYVKKQTEEICMLAVLENGMALEFVENQTKKICMLAVQQNGMALEFVENQTEKICKLAVQQNGLALYSVEEQTEEICKLAVQQNGCALQYVDEQTEEICKLAVQQNVFSRDFVELDFQYLFW